MIWASVACGVGDAMKVVVVGGGVIGSSIAYQLAKKQISSVIVDAAGVASCASGKAGGFLAKDWNDGSPVGSLARLSFDMHEHLAAELAASVGADVNYRRLRCNAVAVDEAAARTKPTSRKLANVEWADLGVVAARPMGDETTIAQVHPKLLTEAMIQAATDSGHTEVKIGTAERVTASEQDGARVVLSSGEVLSGDAVVIAAGPWTNLAKLFSDSPGLQRQPRLTMLGQKYHSLLVKPRSGRVLNEAVFFQGLGET